MSESKKNGGSKKELPVKKIALIGARGSGKSKLSMVLTRQLRLPLLSMDTLIEYEQGQSISDIVAKNGWSFFRDQEYECLWKANKLPELILDCGGGIVTDLAMDGTEMKSDRKIKLLADFFVIYLDAPLQEVKKKILGDAKRPSLTDELSADEIFYRRRPWYQQAANVTIPVDKKHRKQAVKKILSHLDAF